MLYVGYLLWIIGALIAISFLINVRRLVKHGTGVTKQTMNTIMLFYVSLIIVIVVPISSFHLLWLFPASIIAGSFSISFPFSLLSIPGNLFSKICFIGIGDEETICPTEHVPISSETTSVSMAIGRDGNVAGKVIRNTNGKSSIILDNKDGKCDFMALLFSMFIVFSDNLNDEDKQIFTKWTGLPLSPWSQTHREIFALALMHHLHELKETAALVPDALQGAMEMFPPNLLPPLEKPLSNDIRRLFNKIFSGMNDIDNKV